MQLKRIIKRDYSKWYDEPYIYEKVNDKYEPITYGKFFESVLGISKYLIDNGYKNKNIMIISENSIRLMEFDLTISLYLSEYINKSAFNS